MRDERIRAAAILSVSTLIFLLGYVLMTIYTDPTTESIRFQSHHYDITWRYWLQSRYYPPFWDYFWHLFTLVFGPKFIYTSIANMLFVLLGALLVYRLLTSEGARADMAAAGYAMTLLTPAALIAALRLRVETMMWFLLIGFIYFLVRSRTFTRAKESALSATCLSLGLLGKWSFFGYSFLPALIESLTPTRKPARKLLGLIAFAITGLILCGPWYLGVMEPERILPSATNDPSLPVYSFTGMVKLNLSIIYRDLWGPILTVLGAALVALALLLARTRTLLLLLASFAGSIIFFSIPTHTEERYLWPLVPVAAAAVALSLHTLGKRLKLKGFAATAMLCIALVNLTITLGLFMRSSPEPHELALRLFRLPKGTHERYHQCFMRVPALTGVDRPYIGIFPPMEYEFLDWGYSEYLKRISPDLAPYTISPHDLTVYWRYQEELRAMKFDAIAMNCGTDGDCDRAFEVFLEHEKWRLRVPYYQPGLKEDEVKIFDPESIIDDYELIKKHYSPVALCESYPGYVLVIWVRK